MDRSIDNSGVNHIISLPDNPILIVALQAKLIEYHKRLDLISLNGFPSYEIFLNDFSFFATSI
jgi:hypothetical protein